jgi:hypothetical protein
MALTVGRCETAGGAALEATGIAGMPLTVGRCPGGSGAVEGTAGTAPEGGGRTAVAPGAPEAGAAAPPAD